MPNIDKDIGTKLIALTHQHDQSIIAHEKMLQELTNKLTGQSISLDLMDKGIQEMFDKDSANYIKIEDICKKLSQIDYSMKKLFENQDIILKALGITKE